MSNILSRFPSWLYSALGLSEPNIPRALETDLILSVLDVYQSGVGVARYVTQVVNHPASTASLTYEITPRDENLVRLILGTDIDRQGGAGTPTYSYFLEDGPVTVENILLAARTLGAGPDLDSWTTISNGQRWIIPPNFRLRVNLPTTVAGETWRVRTAWVETRAGFKLW